MPARRYLEIIPAYSRRQNYIYSRDSYCIMSLMTTISIIVMKDFTSKLQKIVEVQGFENADINFAIIGHPGKYLHKVCFPSLLPPHD